MNASERQTILAAYYGVRDRYDTLARELRRPFDADIDPSVPSDAIYTINHRLKDESRLLEKLNNASVTATPENFQDLVDDILGLRIVCLRLSDVDRIETFLQSLFDERRLTLLRGPERKRTFVLQVDPRDDVPEGLDLQYSGYSSIHYLVGLGEASRPPDHLGVLRAELQVRTLLEEAWGEIDHKYRYEFARSGSEMPELLTRGFYSFAAYLQAAALQAEYLCMEAERLTPAEAPQELVAPRGRGPMVRGYAVRDIQREIRNALGVTPSARTVNYLARRLSEARVTEVDQLGRSILTEPVVGRFRQIFEEEAGRSPFTDDEESDVDMINALNYALVRKRQKESVANEGVRDVLKRRFKKSFLYVFVYPDGRRTRISTTVPMEQGTGISIHDVGRFVIDRVEIDPVDKLDGVLHLVARPEETARRRDGS